MKAIIDSMQSSPRVVSLLGAVSGWLSLDMLRTAQIFAAIVAGLVSLCALILTAPKAIAEVRRWLR